MGGGMMFRSMARLVGATAIGAVAAPSTEAFCHVHSPASSKPQELRSSAIKLQQQDTCKDILPCVDSQFYDELDWEFASLDSSSDGGGEVEEEVAETSPVSDSLRKLVFSSPPTEEEVNEATNDLHAVLHLSLPPLNFGNSAEQSMKYEENMQLPLDALDKELMGSSFTYPKQLGNLASGNNSVMQAFKLLQTNPKVQDAVKSLACDPAIWKAVLDNEKIQELTLSTPFVEGPVHDDKDDIKNRDEKYFKRFTSRMYGIVKEKVVQLFYDVVLVLNSIFGSVEKTILGKGSSNLDKTVVSCMVLAVAVLIVVVLKRAGAK